MTIHKITTILALCLSVLALPACDDASVGEGYYSETGTEAAGYYCEEKDGSLEPSTDSSACPGGTLVYCAEGPNGEPLGCTEVGALVSDEPVQVPLAAAMDPCGSGICCETSSSNPYAAGNDYGGCTSGSIETCTGYFLSCGVQCYNGDDTCHALIGEFNECCLGASGG